MKETRHKKIAVCLTEGELALLNEYVLAISVEEKKRVSMSEVIWRSLGDIINTK